MGCWPVVGQRWLDNGLDLFFSCLWIETPSTLLNTEYRAAMKGHTSVIKDLLDSIKITIFLRYTAGNSVRTRWCHLSAWLANHCAGFGSFYVGARGANHIKMFFFFFFTPIRVLLLISVDKPTRIVSRREPRTHFLKF